MILSATSRLSTMLGSLLEFVSPITRTFVLMYMLLRKNCAAEEEDKDKW